MRVETRSREGLPDLGNGLVQGWLQFPKSWEPWGPDLWSLRNAHRTKQATTEGGAESTSSYRTRVWCSESEHTDIMRQVQGKGQWGTRVQKENRDWADLMPSQDGKKQSRLKLNPPSNLSWGCQHGCERIWSKPNLVEPSMVLFNGVQVLEKKLQNSGKYIP